MIYDILQAQDLVFSKLKEPVLPSVIEWDAADQ